MRLRIETQSGESKIVDLNGEVTIGRASVSQIVVSDQSVSRLHATFWQENGEVWIADENSTNGTYVNGQRISKPVKVRVGDEIRLGFGTYVFVESNFERAKNYFAQDSIADRNKSDSIKPEPFKPASTSVKNAGQNKNAIEPQTLLVLAGLSAFAIIFFALIAILIAKRFETKDDVPSSPTVRSGVLIPVRVIDPLGGEDPEDLDDLIASWEAEEKELKAEDLNEITNVSADASELKVSIEFWKQQRELALAPRVGVTGIRPPGLDIPSELYGDGVVKQKAKLSQMLRLGYQQPMDFADLAKKKLSRELIELPMATESYFLDVGGSALEDAFTAFSFETGSVPIQPGTEKFEVLRRLAENFDGQRYDLNNSRDRKQMRIRLLRMFHPRAKPILKEIADTYFQKFRRPLRVTSLTRSMDYQIMLNQTNPNSFKVRGAGSLPPHTSGCAFDLARKHMTVEEQNFLMQKLAEMERRGLIDALIEYGDNACFHIFIYPDGKPP